MKKDKQKVIGEELSDERLKKFLELQPPVGINRDHHILTRAYRYLRPDDFDRFMTFFVAAGLNSNATDPQGKTLTERLTKQHLATPYLNALKKAEAQRSGQTAI